MDYLEAVLQLVMWAMEPFIGNINMDEKKYSAMQGIIHFIGWTILIGILIWVFRYMKKHTQEDERMKKYYGSSENKNSENQQKDL